MSKTAAAATMTISSPSVRNPNRERMRRRRRRAVYPSSSSNSPTVLVLVLVLLCTLFAAGFLLPKEHHNTVTAAIYLPDYNRSFVSLPGLFGGQLSSGSDENDNDYDYDPPATAYLTVVNEQPLMCPDELKRIRPMPPFYSKNNEKGNENNEYENGNENNENVLLFDPNPMNSSTIESTNGNGNNNGNNNGNGNNNDGSDPYGMDDLFGDIQPLPPPRDGLPVALLVERGMCTFYEKAVMASKYGPSVRYVIVYDDQIVPDLVPMSSEFDTDITLLFVSARTGRELADLILLTQRGANENENDNDNDNESIFQGYNIRVEMDGSSPYFPPAYPGLNMAAYFLAAMSGFLAFLIFFGCLLICAQCGCITAAPDEHGRIVLFAGGPGIRHTEGLARIIRVHKLTLNQVMLLDEEDYSVSVPEEGGDEEEEEGGNCCAICLEDFGHKEKVRVLPCGHKFHEDCLIPWLTERHASCPLCKMDVLKHVQEIERKNNSNKKGCGGSAEENKKARRVIGDDRPDGLPGGDDNNDNGDGNDNNGDSSSSPAAAAQTSPFPRSVWYRLRGWSLVANNAPSETDSGAEDDGGGGGWSGSSIEMGIRAPPLAAAAPVPAPAPAQPRIVSTGTSASGPE